jgi:3-oxoisoapionate kinase
MMHEAKEIVLAFYGDDFTGSTDALEFMSRAGAKTVLFLDTPTAAQFAKYKDLDSFGVAGMTRAMAPEAIFKTLEVAFEGMKTFNPRHVHYKVCSTFDSSPTIGNIGTAIKVGSAIFKNTFIPILVAAPHLGRYMSFGHLFARMGIGSKGEIHRLDRHPSMSKHPTTPADESDLRKHLAKQIDVPMGLIDLIDLEKSPEQISAKVEDEIAAGKQIVFFDGMYAHQMATIGEVIDAKVKLGTPLFSVGSSGVDKAFGDFWANKGKLKERTEWETLKPVSKMLVLSGSVSPVTAGQINWAMQHEFEEVAVEVAALEEEKQAAFIEKAANKIAQLLKEGKSVILHTSIGPTDPRLTETMAYFKTLGLDETAIRTQTAMRFGKILGQTARKALESVPVQRLVIAGGDTSSYAARELGIEAVEMIAPIYPGAPMCRAFAPGSPVDQIEVNLKGGQVGDETYFGALKQGKV